MMAMVLITYDIACCIIFAQDRARISFWVIFFVSLLQSVLHSLLYASIATSVAAIFPGLSLFTANFLGGWSSHIRVGTWPTETPPPAGATERSGQAAVDVGDADDENAGLIADAEKSD